MKGLARAIAILTALAWTCWATPAIAQVLPAPAPTAASQSQPDAFAGINPLRVLDDAARVLDRSGADSETVPTLPGQAPIGSARAAGRGLSVAINVMLVLTVLSLVPTIMLMSTCFVRIIIVLALLRQAIGAQSVPPAQVITALALFMTAMVMQPTLSRVWNEAVVPYQSGQIRDYDALWSAGSAPFRDFMFDQIEATGNWSSLYMLLERRGIDTSRPELMTRGDVPTTVLVPAYMLSELKTAFLMGFRVYLPFLVIDMVIASLLISMSMMMLPPVLISLPFKLLLFVLADGWTLVVGSLLESFVPEGASPRLSDAPAAAALLLIPLCVRATEGRGAGPFCSRGARRPVHGRRRFCDLSRP